MWQDRDLLYRYRIQLHNQIVDCAEGHATAADKFSLSTMWTRNYGHPLLF